MLVMIAQLGINENEIKLRGFCHQTLFVMAPKTSVERLLSIRRQLCHAPG